MTEIPRLHLRETNEDVLVVIPYLPTNIDHSKINLALTDLVDELIYEEELIDYTTFYYTPDALSFTQHLKPSLSIYDCMDDITVKKQTHEAISNEMEIFTKSDLVFVAGPSLYQSKKHHHHNIHEINNAIDYRHFSQSRARLTEPDDLKNIPHPRIGYYGSLDDTFNFSLLAEMADLKPDYQFVIVGPAVNVDPRTFPRRSNIHYLGKKDYQTLPLYLSGWDCTFMPLHLSERTRFISPSKTFEFLAAGKPVVASRIQDIAFPAGEKEIIELAEKAEDFIAAIDRALETKKGPEWLDHIDHFLKDYSWDNNFNQMLKLEEETLTKREHLLTHTKIIHPINLSVSGALQ